MNLILTKSPKTITKQIIKVCNQISPAIPIFIPKIAFDNAIINKCAYNVKNYISQNNGEMILGWEVLIWDNILLEFIGHAVVKVNESIFCVTPSKYGNNKLLFLIDETMTFDFNDSNARLPSMKISISNNPNVQKLINTEKQIYDIKIKYPITSSGQIMLYGQDAQDIMRLEKEKSMLFHLVMKKHIR